MRNSLILLVVTTFLVLACSKSSEQPKNSEEITLQGKWLYVQDYFSDGASMHYVDANPANQYVTFYTNEGIRGNMSLFEDLTTYKVEEPNQIRFISGTAGVSDRLFHFSIDTAEQKLTLSPLDPMCIEGCGYIFKYQ